MLVSCLSRLRLMRWRLPALCSLALLLAGCSALPRGDAFTVRPQVTSLGVEDVRIGSYAIRDGWDPSGITSLITAGLSSGSLPIQATLGVGLDLPGGLPPMAVDGFTWRLDVPGAEPVSGHYQQRVALSPGDATDLRLPVTFDVLGGGQRLTDLARLASQLASQGGLPAGSELALTPGSVSSLGISLPSGIRMPTVYMSVDESGNLQTRY